VTEQILVIDDDPTNIEAVQQQLAHVGYSVLVAYGGESGLAQARVDPPDLVVVDVMRSDLDGPQVCRRLRASGDTVPVLMLSARDSVADRVAGLDAGADDYLVKPFAFDELLARVRALLRRPRFRADGPILRFADLVLNAVTHQVRRSDHYLSLTAKEFDLLELFMRHPRQVLTRDIIYENVWGYDFGGESNIIDVYVRYLRIKLEAGGELRLLQTVRGVGYVLREG
jgi:two-component system response regulator MprA